MRKGLVLSIILLLLWCTSSISLAAEPPTTLEVTIPDYEVTTVRGLDYVEIPQGEVLLAEEGRPMVPYYTTSIDYPNGYQVQDVILEERSGLVTETGLKLPVVILSPSPKLPLEMKTGWYPEEDYSWRLINNLDGSTTLVIVLYPFYYNPETTEVKFYKNYRFSIEYIVSRIAITALTTARDTYELGDRIPIDIQINNSGEAQDITINIVIKQYGLEEIVDGLPLRLLRNLAGNASFTVTWDSGNAEAGFYYAEVTLTDTEGNMLDRKAREIALVTEIVEEKLDCDINEDGRVNYLDLAILGAHYWESTRPPYPKYDINQDGTVDLYDRDLLVAHYEGIVP